MSKKTPYIKKSSILKINNKESRWYYFKVDDLYTNEHDLLSDMGDILGIPFNKVKYTHHFQRLLQDKFINVNSVGGMNSFEPDQIVLRNEGFYIYKDYDLKKDMGISGYLMPDGNFFWSDFGLHSVLLQELLDLDNYKNYLQSNGIALYFSSTNEGIVLLDKTRNENGCLTLNQNVTLETLREFMTENQRNELENQIKDLK